MTPFLLCGLEVFGIVNACGEHMDRLGTGAVKGEQVGSEMLLVRRCLDIEANCPLAGVTVKEYLQNQTNLALGRLINR